jgi:DNA repair exonuclease SbcCD ATPase subunit
MFSQSPFAGPGTGGFVTHTLEFLVILGVALLLGALLYHLATNSRRRRTRALLAELTLLRDEAAGLSQRLTAAEENLARAREDLAAAAGQLARNQEHDAAATPQLNESVQALRAQQETLAGEVAGLRRDLGQLAVIPPAARTEA